MNDNEYDEWEINEPKPLVSVNQVLVVFCLVVAISAYALAISSLLR